MAQLVVRRIENEVKAGLRRRAERNGRSMEEEVRSILREAVKDEAPAVGLGTLIVSHFAGKGIGLTEDIPELRGFPVRPAEFED